MGWRKGTSVRGRGAREEDPGPRPGPRREQKAVGWGGVGREPRGTDAETQKPAHLQAAVSRKRPERGSLTAPLPKLRGNIWN